MPGLDRINSCREFWVWQSEFQFDSRCGFVTTELACRTECDDVKIKKWPRGAEISNKTYTVLDFGRECNQSQITRAKRRPRLVWRRSCFREKEYVSRYVTGLLRAGSRKWNQELRKKQSPHMYIIRAWTLVPRHRDTSQQMLKYATITWYYF